MLKVKDTIKKMQGAEDEAKQMVEKALSTLISYKTQAFSDAQSRMNILQKDYNLKVQELLSRTKIDNQRAIDALKNENSKGYHRKYDISNNKLLLDLEVWKRAGFQYSTFAEESEFKTRSIDAKNTIKALPLRRYRLANDTKQNVLVAKGKLNDEARSRTHIGVIGEKVLLKEIDPQFLNNGNEFDNVLIQYLSLKALSSIADDVDLIKSQLRTLNSFISVQSPVSISIDNMKSNVESKVTNETIGDLAARVILLEAESSSRNVSLQLQNIRQSLRIHREDVRLEKFVSVSGAQLISSFRELSHTFQLQSLQEATFSKRHQLLSSTIENLKLMSGLIESVNSTMR